MIQVRIDDDAARVVRDCAERWDMSLAATVAAIICEWADDSAPRTVDVVSPLLNAVPARATVSARRIGR